MKSKIARIPKRNRFAKFYRSNVKSLGIILPSLFIFSSLKTMWKQCTISSGIFVFVFIQGCSRVSEKNSYEEISFEFPEDALGVISASDNPHDNLQDLNGVDPQKLLEEMLARGEDPHAGLKDMKSQGQGAPLFPNEMSTGQIPAGKEGKMLLASKGNSPVMWKTPPGWQEIPGSGMRIVSFKNPLTPGSDISIVSLSGPAGGIVANINRWLAQIKLPTLSSDQLNHFLSSQETLKNGGGLTITLVDFSTLQSGADSQHPSMLGAIIEKETETIFIKMTGTLAELQTNRKAFKALCQSLLVFSKPML